MALKTSGTAADYDFRDIEDAFALVHNVLTPSSAPELFFEAVRQAQFKLDFYPPPRKRVPKFQFATDKSRRWFWWQVSKGAIKVPHQRTGRLREATELQVLKAEPTRFIILVNVDVTKARYAPYVIGTQQAPGHQVTGWNQLYTSVSDATPGLIHDLTPAYVANIRGYLKAGF